MNILKRYRRTLLLYASIIAGIFFFSKCVNSENDKKEAEPKEDHLTASLPGKKIAYDQFAGSAVCSNCHKDISASYFHTSHFATSQTATERTIKGSFTRGENIFQYSPDRIVKLEKRDSGLYEVYYYRGEERVVRRFDIVVGSGTKGQTYLSWVGDQLIELPVSYFTQMHQWANSPGYPLYPTLFNRPATTRCLECHSTFAGTLTPPMQEPEKFDSTKLILSVGCEKCHGPAAAHVAFETKNHNDSVGRFIINPGKLSRKLNLDVCSLCHAGRLQKSKPSFEFIPGDTLSNYFQMAASPVAPTIDVHGNQFGLLSASKCFRMSETMTCVTCHDVHKNERGNMQVFSQRCLTCHTQVHKTIPGISQKELVRNCIDCHMPVQQSMSVTFLLQGKNQPVNAMMRTHFITVYPDETKKFIENLKLSPKKKT